MRPGCRDPEPAQRASYRYVVEALQCHFGDLQQAEVHRSCLKVQTPFRTHVKQAHPKAIQEVLTQTSEMEAFPKTTTDASRLVLPRYEGGTDTLLYQAVV
ncbi:hypothetical protein E2C01_044624 [Portunus trituberculatus]|uniref:Uncharacterized protein n=1 Tax=Portunus trituberculatus TaxID=210409 RepID=A0A5B7FSM1_PORTR|nr:hypothetical protein [Portunus trituberculatus]